MTLHPQFVIDEKGRKKSVLLPYKDYKELLELAQDVIDASLIDEVRSEPTVPWEEVKKKEDKRRGLKR
ncbi:MAG: hypothetical protein WA666_05755 [Nitrospirota bacterium]